MTQKTAVDHLNDRLLATQAHLGMIQAEVARLSTRDVPVTTKELARIVEVASMATEQAVLVHEAQVLSKAAGSFSKYSKSSITESAAAKKITAMAEYARRRADGLNQWKPAKP